MILNSRGEEIFVGHPTHPGEVLADKLTARNSTVAMALNLEEALQKDASFWLNAQRNANRDMAYYKAKRELKRLNVPEARQKELLKAVVS